MIFDQLCGVAERQMPALLPVLKRARLFRFQAEALSSARFDHQSADRLRRIWTTFRMPFACMAIETPRAVSLLWEEEPQEGMCVERCAVEAQLLTLDRALSASNPAPVAETLRKQAEALHREHGDLLLVTVGKVRGVPDSALFAGTLALAMTVRKDQMVQPPAALMRGGGERVLSEAFVRNSREAFERVAFLVPEFYTERRPTSHRPIPKAAVPRSDQRVVCEVFV